jgi:predicted Fe-S protein YdhL (DUF1289 family)
MNTHTADAPRSPCIDICVLDDGDICVGCYRSASEIAAWASLDAAGKCRVIELALERRRAAGALL